MLVDRGRKTGYNSSMAKGTFIIMRATDEDRAVLAYCRKASSGTTAEVLRAALRRYMTHLKRTKR